MFLALASAPCFTSLSWTELADLLQRSLFSISCQLHYPSRESSASKLRQPLGTSRPRLVKTQSPESPFINADFSTALVPTGGAWGWGVQREGEMGDEKPAVTEADPSCGGFLTGPKLLSQAVERAPRGCLNGFSWAQDGVSPSCTWPLVSLQMKEVKSRQMPPG